MPRGKPRSGRCGVPEPFYVKWDAARLRWAVQQGGRWRFATSICITGTTASEGGALGGVGFVRTLKRGTIMVNA